MAGRSQIPFIVVNATGDAIEGATVAITHRQGGAAATVYTSETSSVTLGTGTPQVVTQKDGRIPGWLPEGSYTIVITHASLPGSPWTRALDVAKGSGVGNLLNNVVTAAKIVAAAVTTAKLATDSVTTANIGNGQVGESKIADNAASTRTIAADNVTNPKLATDSIDQRTIADDAVTTNKIALLAVGTSELVDSAVISGKYAAGAVTTPKILDGEVLTAAIADDAVTAPKFGLNTLKPRNFANSVLPVGAIVPFAFEVVKGSGVAAYAEKGWLLCDGTSYTPAAQPLLYSVIGGTYGFVASAQQGVISFAIPDLRGRVPYGVNAGSTGIGALGTRESPAGDVSVRGPKHLHWCNSTASLSGGSHAHEYWDAIDVKEGGQLYDIGVGSSMHNYYSNSFRGGGMKTGGEHGHNMTGSWGDTNGLSNGPAFITMQYFIKAF